MKECSCEWCNRNEYNFKQFRRYENKWYCMKHYNQLRNHGEITDFKEKHNILYGVALSDMPKGWIGDNQREYDCWRSMIIRCYSEKYQEKNQTYKDCYVCERWLKLSNFIKDMSNIDGYEEWLNNPGKYALDKDIKSNGKNKCYCLENCMFTTNINNAKQARKTTDYNFMQGENNPMYGKHGKDNPNSRPVVQLNKDIKLINIFGGAKEAEENTKIKASNITVCCQGKIKSSGKDENKNKYFWMYEENYNLFIKLNEYYNFDKLKYDKYKNR